MISVAKTGSFNGLAPSHPASSLRSDWIWRPSRSSTARISFLEWSNTSIQHHASIMCSATGSPEKGLPCFYGKHHSKSPSMENPVPWSLHLIIPMLLYAFYCTILLHIFVATIPFCWAASAVRWLQVKEKRASHLYKFVICCPFLHDSPCYLQHLKAW